MEYFGLERLKNVNSNLNKELFDYFTGYIESNFKKYKGWDHDDIINIAVIDIRENSQIAWEFLEQSDCDFIYEVIPNLFAFLEEYKDLAVIRIRVVDKDQAMFPNGCCYIIPLARNKVFVFRSDDFMFEKTSRKILDIEETKTIATSWIAQMVKNIEKGLKERDE